MQKEFKLIDKLKKTKPNISRVVSIELIIKVISETKSLHICVM